MEEILISVLGRRLGLTVAEGENAINAFLDLRSEIARHRDQLQRDGRLSDLITAHEVPKLQTKLLEVSDKLHDNTLYGKLCDPCNAVVLIETLDNITIPPPTLNSIIQYAIKHGHSFALSIILCHWKTAPTTLSATILSQSLAHCLSYDNLQSQTTQVIDLIPTLSAIEFCLPHSGCLAAFVGFEHVLRLSEFGHANLLKRVLGIPNLQVLSLEAPELSPRNGEGEFWASLSKLKSNQQKWWKKPSKSSEEGKSWTLKKCLSLALFRAAVGSHTRCVQLLLGFLSSDRTMIPILQIVKRVCQGASVRACISFTLEGFGAQKPKPKRRNWWKRNNSETVTNHCALEDVEEFPNMGKLDEAAFRFVFDVQLTVVNPREALCNDSGFGPSPLPPSISDKFGSATIAETPVPPVLVEANETEKAGVLSTKSKDPHQLTKVESTTETTNQTTPPVLVNPEDNQRLIETSTHPEGNLDGKETIAGSMEAQDLVKGESSHIKNDMVDSTSQHVSDHGITTSGILATAVNNPGEIKDANGTNVVDANLLGTPVDNPSADVTVPSVIENPSTVTSVAEVNPSGNPSALEQESTTTPPGVVTSNTVPDSSATAPPGDTLTAIKQSIKIHDQFESLLSKLPEDLYFRCLMLLPRRDLFNLTSTCREYSSLRTYIDFFAEYLIVTEGLEAALLTTISNPPPKVNSLELLQSVTCPDDFPGNLTRDIATKVLRKCVELKKSQHFEHLIKTDPPSPFNIKSQHSNLNEWLTTAVTNDDSDMILLLCKLGANAHLTDQNLLLEAVRLGNYLSVDALLNCKADAKKSDSAAFRLCAETTTPEAARILARLLVARADIGAKSHEALRKASLKGNPDVLKVLTTVVGQFAISGAKGWEARSALKHMYQVLAREKHADALRAVLEEKSAWAWEGCLDNILKPIIRQAVTDSNVPMVQAIALSGDCWKELIKGFEGKSLLQMAAKVKLSDHKKPLAFGDAIFGSARKKGARRVASSDESLEQLANSSVDRKDSLTGGAPMARRGSNPESAEDLRGAQSNRKEIDQASAAMAEAMIAGVAQISRARYRESTIVHDGVDAWEFIRNAECPALHSLKEAILLEAVKYGHEMVIDAVISTLQPNLVGAAGNDVLLAAIEHGNVKAIASLISAGANIEEVADHAIQHAEGAGNTEVIKYIKMNKEIRARKSATVFRPKATKGF